MMSLPMWLSGPMFLLRVSVQGDLCAGGGAPCRETPTESEKRVVHILLECILVNIYF